MGSGQKAAQVPQPTNFSELAGVQLSQPRRLAVPRLSPFRRLAVPTHVGLSCPNPFGVSGELSSPLPAPAIPICITRDAFSCPNLRRSAVLTLQRLAETINESACRVLAGVALQCVSLRFGEYGVEAVLSQQRTGDFKEAVIAVNGDLRLLE
jgi:hypothetical protein